MSLEKLAKVSLQWAKTAATQTKIRNFEAKKRGNKLEMAVFLGFLRKKSSKNLQVSIIYPNFAADFV